MNTSISKEFTGRFAGFLYVTASLTLLIYTMVPAFDTIDRGLTRQAGAAILLSGVAAVFFPWRRIPRWVQLALPLYALVLAVFLPGAINADPTLGYPFLLLVFVWTAVATDIWVVVAGFVLSVVTVVIGMSVEHTPDSDQILTAFNTLFVGLIVGLVLAYTMGRLQRSQTRAKSQRKALEVLIAAVEQLAIELTGDGVGNQVARYAYELTGATWSAVMLLDAEGEVVKHYGSGVSLSPEEAPQMPVSVWTELRRGVLMITATDELEQRTCLDDVRSVLWAPLRGANESMGVVAIGLREKPDEVIDFKRFMMRALASQGGLAFERVHLTLSLLDQSLRDELTGVGNRRHAMALLARVSDGDGVVVLDLDHFKEVNDSFGHDRGDELLTELAGYLGEALRDQDAIARYGGDEFLAILWGVGEKAEEVTHRLVEGWRQRNPSASLSVGVAVHHHAQPANVTFQHADAALYRAKDLGRDQGVVFRPDEHLPDPHEWGEAVPFASATALDSEDEAKVSRS